MFRAIGVDSFNFVLKHSNPEQARGFRSLRSLNIQTFKHFNIQTLQSRASSRISLTCVRSTLKHSNPEQARGFRSLRSLNIQTFKHFLFIKITNS